MVTFSSFGQLRRAPSRPRRSLLALVFATALLSGLLLLATVAAGATSTRAGAPGTWSLLGSGIRTVSGQIGTARTSDGVLHVIWSRGGAGTPYALFDTTVTPAGNVSPAQTIVSGWARIDDVDATVTKGKPLTIGFTGTKTDTTGDPTNGLTLATKNGSWTVGATAVYSTDLVGSSVPAIGYSGTGQPIQAWSAGGKITVHVGTDAGAMISDTTMLEILEAKTAQTSGDLYERAASYFDKVYQIRSGSGVGVFAPQYGTRRGFFGGLAWQF